MLPQISRDLWEYLKETDKTIQASAQGLFMLMTNGIGASIGTLLAGNIVNHFCQWKNGFLLGDWQTTWTIFAAYSLLIAVLFLFIFKYKHSSSQNK